MNKFDASSVGWRLVYFDIHCTVHMHTSFTGFSCGITQTVRRDHCCPVQFAATECYSMTSCSTVDGHVVCYYAHCSSTSLSLAKWHYVHCRFSLYLLPNPFFHFVVTDCYSMMWVLLCCSHAMLADRLGWQDLLYRDQQTAATESAYFSA